MFSYISFFNKSSRPALVIFLDEAEAEELLPARKKSPLHITDAGSHTILVTDIFSNILFNLYLPLYPNTFNTLVIEDSTAYLTDHFL